MLDIDVDDPLMAEGLALDADIPEHLWDTIDVEASVMGHGSHVPDLGGLAS